MNFTISAPSIKPGTPRRTRARWGAGRVKLVPSSSDARTASTTGGIGVAERDRAQPHAVLDELVAVDVPDVAALAARDQRRRELGVLVVALGVGVATARHERAQPRGELLSTGKLHRPAPGLATTRGDGPSGAPIVTPRGSIM